MKPRHAQADSAPPGNLRPCCEGDSCIRKQLDNLLDPAAPIVERIHITACEVARTCGSLEKEDLHSCAGKLFELTPECDLTELFVIAYQTERDALDGRRDLEKRYAAGRL